MPRLPPPRRHLLGRSKAASPAQGATVRKTCGSPDTVAFDAAIRHGSARANADENPLRGQFFLHGQRVPLDRAALRPRPPADDTDNGDGDVPGCGPWTCPHPGDAALNPADVREVA